MMISIKMTILLLLLLFVGLAQTSRLHSMPRFGLSVEMFSKQAFDEKAPFCKLEREPCGFYDLSLDGNSRLEWVKSWCRCPARHDCTFDEPDLRHKVYRFVCKREQQIAASGGKSNRLVVRRHGRRRSTPSSGAAGS